MDILEWVRDFRFLRSETTSFETQYLIFIVVVVMKTKACKKIYKLKFFGPSKNTNCYGQKSDIDLKESTLWQPFASRINFKVACCRAYLKAAFSNS